jgi:4-diphosphocytidyl-2-C-methyl-D-erythritol kinase
MHKLLEIKAPAKINIGLNIGRKRPDGFHEIETFMQTVDLSDYIAISDTDEFQFKTSGYEFPVDEENICVRAYKLFASRIGYAPKVAIELKKNIPVGAGLGGGSSDAAAVIKGLNIYTESGLSDRELADMGSSIGSDIPFFLSAPRGSAFCTGRGDLVKPMKPVWIGYAVIAFTGVHISTAEAYKRIDENLTNLKKNVNLKRYIAHHFPAKKGLNKFKNDFSEIVFNWYSELEEIALLFTRAGAEYSNLSGSGSAVFGLFLKLGDAQKALTMLPDKIFKTVASTPVPEHLA